MKYRILKTSSTKHLLNTDSQARHLDFPDFKIFSPLKAIVQRVKNFILPVGTYELIPLLIGGYNFYSGSLPSDISSQTVAADSISALFSVHKSLHFGHASAFCQ